jgi:hypothetical protein
MEVPVGTPGGGGVGWARMGGAQLLRTIGGKDATDKRLPVYFLFAPEEHIVSGRLAFTHGDAPLLLVTDAGHDVVHIVNVTTSEHVGYVPRPS